MRIERDQKTKLDPSCVFYRDFAVIGKLSGVTRDAQVIRFPQFFPLLGLKFQSRTATVGCSKKFIRNLLSNYQLLMVAAYFLGAIADMVHARICASRWHS